MADPGRLAIAVALASAPTGCVRFVELGRGLGLSEGNLASHLRRLVHAGLVEARRNGSRGRASRTEFLLTSVGRARLAVVGEEMEAAGRAVAAALAQPGPLGARLNAPRTPRQAVGAPAGFAMEVPEPDTESTLVDERFSGPD